MVGTGTHSEHRSACLVLLCWTLQTPGLDGLPPSRSQDVWAPGAIRGHLCCTSWLCSSLGKCPDSQRSEGTLPSCGPCHLSRTGPGWASALGDRCLPGARPIRQQRSLRGRRGQGGTTAARSQSRGADAGRHTRGSRSRWRSCCPLASWLSPALAVTELRGQDPDPGSDLGPSFSHPQIEENIVSTHWAAPGRGVMGETKVSAPGCAHRSATKDRTGTAEVSVRVQGKHTLCPTGPGLTVGPLPP